MISEGALVVRLILSVIFGGLVGIEREMHGKPAGLRTHAIVSLGACLFTIASLAFGGDDTAILVDPSRVAAGIVTGIGFLGAGAIFRDENKIRGLTTAADMWLVAAIGLAVGMGYYLAAVTATTIGLVVLYSGTIWKKRKQRKQLKLS